MFHMLFSEHQETKQTWENLVSEILMMHEHLLITWYVSSTILSILCISFNPHNNLRNKIENIIISTERLLKNSSLIKKECINFNNLNLHI